MAAGRMFADTAARGLLNVDGHLSGPGQSTPTGIRRPHGQSPHGLQKAPPAAPWDRSDTSPNRGSVPGPGLDGRTGKARTASRRRRQERRLGPLGHLCWVLRAAAHAADQGVLGDAVGSEKLSCAIEVDWIG